MRKVIFITATVLVFLLPNLLIVHKEKILADGTTVLVDLGPVDPRSLIQGDYMQLAYRIPPEIRSRIGDGPTSGKVVVSLDGNRVAEIIRLYGPEEDLGPGEHLLGYRMRGRRQNIQLGARSFFFQEGQSQYYTGARYGELKVTPSGTSVLVGLRDENFRPMGPEEE